MSARMFAAGLGLSALLANPAYAESSEPQKLALAAKMCLKEKAPKKISGMRAISMILIDKQGEPMRAYVCMVAPKNTPRYNVYVSHALFRDDGLIALTGDNSRSCGTEPDPTNTPPICRKDVRRFVTRGSTLAPVCRVISTNPPVPDPSGCTQNYNNFAQKAEVMTIWQRKLVAPSIRRQWLVPVRRAKVI